LGDVFRVNDGEFASFSSFLVSAVIATGLQFLVRDRAVSSLIKILSLNCLLFVFGDLTQFLLNFLDCGGLLRVR